MQKQGKARPGKARQGKEEWSKRAQSQVTLLYGEETFGGARPLWTVFVMYPKMCNKNQARLAKNERLWQGPRQQVGIRTCTEKNRAEQSRPPAGRGRGSEIRDGRARSVCCLAPGPSRLHSIPLPCLRSLTHQSLTHAPSLLPPS